MASSGSRWLLPSAPDTFGLQVRTGLALVLRVLAPAARPALAVGRPGVVGELVPEAAAAFIEAEGGEAIGERESARVEESIISRSLHVPLFCQSHEHLADRGLVGHQEAGQVGGRGG